MLGMGEGTVEGEIPGVGKEPELIICGELPPDPKISSLGALCKCAVTILVIAEGTWLDWGPKSPREWSENDINLSSPTGKEPDII